MNFTEVRVPTNKFIVCIDSKARNTDLYPSPNSYVVEFQKTFKNIVSVELVAAIYDGISPDHYVNLFIDELSSGSDIISNVTSSTGSFTQLPLTNTINKYTQKMYRSLKTFDHPLAKLGKFSIRFVGSDSLPYGISEHFLRFEIICCKYESTVESNNLEVASNVVHMYKPIVEAGKDISDIAYITDPYLLLGITKENAANIKNLTAAFKQKTTMLKVKGGTQWEYNRLKHAFKELAGKLTAAAPKHTS